MGVQNYPAIRRSIPTVALLDNWLRWSSACKSICFCHIHSCVLSTLVLYMYLLLYRQLETPTHRVVHEECRVLRENRRLSINATQTLASLETDRLVVLVDSTPNPRLQSATRLLLLLQRLSLKRSVVL